MRAIGAAEILQVSFGAFGLGPPDHPSRLDVDGSEQVVRGRGDEDQTACRRQRSAIVGQPDPDRKFQRNAEGAIFGGKAKRKSWPQSGRLGLNLGDLALRRDVERPNFASGEVERAWRKRG